MKGAPSSFRYFFRWRFLLLAALWIFLVIPASADAATIEEGSRLQPRFQTALLSGTEVFQGSDGTEDIRLTHSGEAPDRSTILLLGFDNPVPGMLQDETGNYTITKASYLFSREGRLGKGAALFNREENRIVISSPEEIWPGREVLDDFTIQFWIKPLHFFDRSVIFKKVGLLDGFRRGLEIYIEDSHIHVEAPHLFEDNEGRLHSIHLRSRNHLELNRWTHVAVSYQATTGKWILYFNGREERSDRARDQNEIWRARFHPLDRSPIVIGEKLTALLDDFAIQNRFVGYDHIQDLRNTIYPSLRTEDPGGRRGEQNSGEVVSNVIHPGGRADLQGRGKIEYQAREPEGSELAFYVRTAPHPFDRDTPERELPWRRTAGNSVRLPHFAYLQWKAVLRADPVGMHSPVLKNVSIRFTPIVRPAPPGRLREVPELTGGERICLQWNESPGDEVRKTGGYIVYYGLRPGDYTGQIRYRVDATGKAAPLRREASLPLTPEERAEAKLKPEKIKKDFRRVVRLELDNDLIESNIARSERREWMPYLKPDQTYYFAVSAYSEEGGESKISQEIRVVLRAKPDLPADDQGGN